MPITVHSGPEQDPTVINKKDIVDVQPTNNMDEKSRIILQGICKVKMSGQSVQCSEIYCQETPDEVWALIK